jgi:glycerol-1-phosphate dehydrogenase [NAD(P)+]
MQHHTHNGKAPSHGFKVAIGTLAVAELYRCLLCLPLDSLDVERAVAAWPSAAAIEASIVESLGDGELADKARLEMSAKAVNATALRDRLLRLREIWPGLRERLNAHLPPVSALREMLAAAAAPTDPRQIGIGRDRLRLSFRGAHLIRRRFTVLDLAAQTGVFEQCMDRLFGAEGPWTHAD